MLSPTDNPRLQHIRTVRMSLEPNLALSEMTQSRRYCQPHFPGGCPSTKVQTLLDYSWTMMRRLTLAVAVEEIVRSRFICLDICTVDKERKPTIREIK
jgi:hypothetical protein